MFVPVTLELLGGFWESLKIFVLTLVFSLPLGLVISRKYIEDAINEYHRIMRANFGDNYTIAYASKALSAKFIYDIIKDMSVHADVVSGGEIYTALAGGMKAENLHFHGGNKTRNEIEYALSMGIGSFVIDNFQEIAIINDLAEMKNHINANG